MSFSRHGFDQLSTNDFDNNISTIGGGGELVSGSVNNSLVGGSEWTSQFGFDTNVDGVAVGTGFTNNVSGLILSWVDLAFQ